MSAALQPHEQIKRETLMRQATKIKGLPKHRVNQRFPKAWVERGRRVMPS
jgi:hypothetical protein